MALYGMMAVLVACATTGQPVSTGRRGDVYGAAPGAMEAGLALLEDRAQNTNTLRGRGTLTGTWAGRSGQHPFAFALRHPDRLRVDILDPAMGTVGILLMHDTTLYWYLPGERRLYASVADMRSLQKIAHIDLDPEQLLQMLSGLPPARTSAWLAREGRLVAPDGRSEILMDAEGRQVSAYRHFRGADGKKVDTEVTFADYRPLRNVRFPYRIAVNTGRGGGEIRVEYHDLEMNPRLEGELFTIEVPATTDIVQW
ncbi:MAG: DUF4292 domain-containing protein [Deltaproteobacteria bacterium]|nr:DUF4292 domain-containing protein [Deltaproteobacteria bacterium]